jgi:hypothetical protein
MKMLLKTQSGKEYKRIAWMGGDRAPEFLYRDCADYRDLVCLFYEEQVSDFEEAWNEMPDQDTKKILWDEQRVTPGRLIGKLCRKLRDKSLKSGKHSRKNYKRFLKKLAQKLYEH